jgi:hypothetical protein
MHNKVEQSPRDVADVKPRASLDCVILGFDKGVKIMFVGL